MDVIILGLIPVYIMQMGISPVFNFGIVVIIQESQMGSLKVLAVPAT